MFPWVLISGVIGARLGFILVNLGNSFYSQNFLNIIDITKGGLSIQGAVIGGAVAVIIYCNRSRLSPLKWGDITAPGLALGQAIGRWGNYFNQEAFGSPTTLPWGIQISVQRQREVAGQEFGPDVHFHPTFAYEMLWDLFNFVLLMWLGRQKRIKFVDGDIFWIYMVVYSIGRFAIESIRVDSARVEGIAVPQVIALLSILLGWGMFLYRHRPGSNAPVSDVNLPDDERQMAEMQRRREARMIGQQPTHQSRLRRVPAIFPAKEADKEERDYTIATESPAEG